MSSAKAVIIDIGSEVSKVGLSGDEEPIVFPSVIGYQKYHDVYHAGKYDILAGDQAFRMRGLLRLLYPLARGRIIDFSGYLYLLSYALTQREIEPTESSIFIVDHGALNREQIANVLFNEWGIKTLYFLNSAILNLWGCGRFTGLSVEIGAGLTAVTPIYNGYVISHAMEYNGMGGGDIINLLSRLLTARGWRTIGGAEREIIRKLYETACYVPRTPAEQTMEYEYVLPDGETLVVSDERKAPELLFNPALLGYEMLPIDHLIYNAVQACDTTIRRELWHDLVLCGGVSQLNGIKERLSDQLSQYLPESVAEELNVVLPKRRAYLAWYGANVLSNREFFQKYWITREMFNQNPTIVNTSF